MNRFAILFALFGLVCAARLSGSLSTTTGSTPSYTTVYAINPSTNKSYQTRTSGSAYSLSVADDSLYSVYAIASANTNVSGWTVNGLMPNTAGQIAVTNGTTAVDFVFEPSYTLILISYSSDGTMKQSTDYTDHLWTTDLSGVTSRFQRTAAVSNQMSTVALAVPLNTRVNIMAETNVATAGLIVLPANNGGLGFGSAEAGGEVVQLNYEMARTAAESLKRKSSSDDAAPTPISQLASVDVLAGPFATEQLRAAAADLVLDQSVAAETALELSRADSSILQYRTSNVTIRGTDEMGRIVSGLSLSVEQTTSSFRFGVYGGQQSAAGPVAWKMLADSGVNAAVVDFWWSKTEPTNGTLEETYILNQKIDYLTSLGLKLRATGLFQPDPSIVPDYVKGVDQSQFGKALYDHVYNVVSRYCTNFELVEVSTDLNNLVSLLGFNSTQLLALQQISLDAIRAAVPGMRTSVTVSNTFDPSSTSLLNAAQFSQQWGVAGQQIDMIGQSIYKPTGSYQPLYSVGTFSDLLDSISSAAKPIRISQVSAPFADEAQGGEFLEQLYTIALSKRYMREVSWWGLMGQSSLFDQDQTPTPLYWAMRNFILAHRSKITLSFDNTVSATMTAFGGTHRVTVYKDGVAIAQSDVEIAEGQPNRMSVQYRTTDGTATVLLNQLNGPVVGVVPAPAQIVGTQGTPNSLSQGVVFAIIFGTIGVVAAMALLAAFVVLRRGKETRRAPDISSGAPVGNVLPGKSFDIDLEAAQDPVALEDATPDTPAPWSGQPLTNVVLEDNESEADGGVDSETDETSDMESVELNEHDISTSTTDTEEEEHL